MMVGMTGFEPATLWSQTRCSTRLSYIPMIESRPERGARVYGNVPIPSIGSVRAFHLAQALFRGGEFLSTH